MRSFDGDWDELLGALPVIEGVSLAAREAILRIDPLEAVAATRLGANRPELLEAGLVVSSGDGAALRVVESYQRPLKALRAIKRSRVFDTSERAAVERYLAERFTRRQLAKLSGARRQGAPLGEIADRVTSGGWIRGFLDTEEPALWEWDLLDERESPRLVPSSVVDTLRAVVRRLLEEGSPVRLGELAADEPDPRLGAALAAGLRYLLFFAALDADGRYPVLGIYPATLERLRRPVPEPPRPVPVERPYRSALLLQDLTTVLVSCSAEPPRLTRQGARLFARAQRQMESALAPLPEPIAERLHLSPSDRVELAVSSLSRLGLVASTGKPGDDLRLRITESGGDWLAGSEKERLGSLLDQLIATRGEGPGSRSLLPDSLHFVPSRVARDLYLYDLDLAEPLIEAFASVSDGEFYELRDFLRYRSRERNPLRDRGAARSLRSPSGAPPPEERLERWWTGQLYDFFAERLFLLGGAAVGLHGEQDRLAFAVTDIGRYLLGLAESFDYHETGDGRVIVQPDFEVVFLAPSPEAEAALGRFARRRPGRTLGGLFHITREAIFAAAAGGMARDQVLETLTRISSKPIPGNVRRQIEDWFGQCRKVTVEPVVLLRCPDPDTATRVLSAGGASFRALTETTLTVKGRRLPAALRRKLREAGVFVDDRHSG